MTQDLMYRPPAFALDDVAALHAAMRERVFATFAAHHDGALRFAYAPVVVDGDNGPLGAVRFHLARANPLSELPDGAALSFSMIAGDAYVSPDWYDTQGRVPTWNYIAVEGRGVVRRLDGGQLRQLLVDLSAEEENKLLPKTPWTIDKVPEEKMGALMNAIVGFSVQFETLEGKFKLSQNVTPEDAEGVIRGMEQRGDAMSLKIAKAMRETRA
jgi:transcriptional regulator